MKQRKKIVVGNIVFQCVPHAELPKYIDEQRVYALAPSGEMFYANPLARNAPASQRFYISLGALPAENFADHVAKMHAELAKASMDVAAYALAARRAQTAEAIEFYQNARNNLIARMRELADNLAFRL